MKETEAVDSVGVSPESLRSAIVFLRGSMCMYRALDPRTSLQPCSPHYWLVWANTLWARDAECSATNGGVNDGINDVVNLVSLLLLGLGQHFCSIWCVDVMPVKWDLKEEKISDGISLP